eukprot:GILI01043241.1.p1 GENE.GILI01043241.1~~GILI01043241.1.p1  ORF type:complete len:360 (+),score=99.25 GILI01043241.1:108-1187(+)
MEEDKCQQVKFFNPAEVLRQSEEEEEVDDVTSPSNGIEEEEEEQMLKCPTCGEDFRLSSLFAHASGCARHHRLLAARQYFEDEMKREVDQELIDLFDFDKYIKEEQYSLLKAMVVHSEIIPGFLYLASCNALDDEEFLQQKGIKHVLNVAKDVNTHKSHFSKLGISVTNFPIDDLESFNIQTYFDQSFALLTDLEARKLPVIVNCAMGVSRSATMVIGYLMHAHGLSLKDAFSIVRERRSVVQPNKGFMKALVRLESKLCQENSLVAPSPVFSSVSSSSASLSSSSSSSSFSLSDAASAASSMSSSAPSPSSIASSSLSISASSCASPSAGEEGSQWKKREVSVPMKFVEIMYSYSGGI